jgi:hypothetical protein
MTKCFWCESSYLPEKQAISENPKVTLHLKCFEEIMRIHNNIKKTTEYLEGRLPRLAANENKIGYDTVEEFLVSMAKFDKQWAKRMEYVKKILSGKET